MGSICHGNMCILLYMKLIWCDGFPEIYARLEEGVGSVCTGICAYVYMLNMVGVVVFQRSMVDWRGWGLSALVQQSAMDLWSIGGGWARFSLS